jgi:hypothetical protein
VISFRKGVIRVEWQRARKPYKPNSRTRKVTGSAQGVKSAKAVIMVKRRIMTTINAYPHFLTGIALE